jgi:HSP20 family protein
LFFSIGAKFDYYIIKNKIMRTLTYYDPLEMMERILTNPLSNISLAEKISYKISEEEESFILKMPLPGLTREDVGIELTGNILTIAGKKTDLSWTSDFEKRFRLPESVNPDGIHCKLENGVLFLTIEKKKESLPRKISVG